MDNIFDSRKSEIKKRVIYTPDTFAKSALYYLQESGCLTAESIHRSERQNLSSFLFFIVADGKGKLKYNGKEYKLQKGNCVFLDCSEKYYHETDALALWTLYWVHFNGGAMESIYKKFRENNDSPVFITARESNYQELINRITDIARSEDSIKDFHINEQLSSLIFDIMSDIRPSSTSEQTVTAKMYEIQAFLDTHYKEKITLEKIEKLYGVNKFYLERMFAALFGTTVTKYLLRKRITEAKQLLRFTDKTISQIGEACGMNDPAYFNRVFKNHENISPKVFRSLWSEK